MELLKKLAQINRLKANDILCAQLSLSDIVNANFSLRAAKKNLPESDFAHFSMIFNSYDSEKEEHYYSHALYEETVQKMVNRFSSIAPYEMISEIDKKVLREEMNAIKKDLDDINFIDAHRIVHEYGGSLARGVDPVLKDMLVRPDFYLKNTKNDIFRAYVIYFGHVYWFRDRTPDQLNTYRSVLMHLDSFVPKEIVDDIKKLKGIVNDKNPIHKWKNSDAIPLAEDKLHDYRMQQAELFSDNIYYKRFCDMTSDTLNKCMEVFGKMKKHQGRLTNEDRYRYLGEYVQYIYSQLDMKVTQADVDLFDSFDNLRGYFEKGVMSVYAQYEKYLFNNQ